MRHRSKMNVTLSGQAAPWRHTGAISFNKVRLMQHSRDEIWRLADTVWLLYFHLYRTIAELCSETCLLTKYETAYFGGELHKCKKSCFDIPIQSPANFSRK